MLDSFADRAHHRGTRSRSRTVRATLTTLLSVTVCAGYFAGTAESTPPAASWQPAVLIDVLDGPLARIDTHPESDPGLCGLLHAMTTQPTRDSDPAGLRRPHTGIEPATLCVAALPGASTLPLAGLDQRLPCFRDGREVPAPMPVRRGDRALGFPTAPTAEEPGSPP